MSIQLRCTCKDIDCETVLIIDPYGQEEDDDTPKIIFLRKFDAAGYLYLDPKLLQVIENAVIIYKQSKGEEV